MTRLLNAVITSALRSKRTFHSHLLACRISFTLPYDESAQIRLHQKSDLDEVRREEVIKTLPLYYF